MWNVNSINEENRADTTEVQHNGASAGFTYLLPTLTYVKHLATNFPLSLSLAFWRMFVIGIGLCSAP